MDQQFKTQIQPFLQTHCFKCHGNGKKKGGLFTAKLLHEVFLNTGLYLLFGGILVGLISGLQGEKVTRTCVGATPHRKGVNVEIDCVASFD